VASLWHTEISLLLVALLPSPGLIEISLLSVALQPKVQGAPQADFLQCIG